MTNTVDFEVAVIGGGAAGLSAAVTLGRARRSVVVIDAGQPRNAPADGVHNFLTRDGMSPGDLLAAGRAEVARYGGAIRPGVAVGARAVGDTFEVDLADGHQLTARRLIVATGLTDELPDVPGLREHWGAGVVHCPYCHGWEVQDQALGVLGSGPMAVHQALLFRQWSSDIVLFLHTAPELTAEQAGQLAARGIKVVTGPVAAIESDGAGITGVRLADGTVVTRQAIVVGPRIVAQSPVLDSLGLQPAPHPLGAEVGQSYPAEPTGATELPGVWLAGNVTDLQAQVIVAAAQGMAVAAAVNASLIADETAAAVAHAGHHHADGLDDLLELEGEVLHEYWDAALTWATQTLDGSPKRLLDLGAGVGTGAIGLSRRFPDAEVIALDVSADSLRRLDHKAAALGLGSRVRTVEADLDQGWPDLGELDLTWASMSLHHLGDVDRTMRDALTATRPGGLFTVAEFSDFLRFLPPDLGVGLPGFEDRLSAALHDENAHAVPEIGSDWAARLRAAGWRIAAEREFAIDLAGSHPKAGGYAHAWFRRLADALSDRLDADDRATLAMLLDPDSPLAVARRTDLRLRGIRTVTVAVRD